MPYVFPVLVVCLCISFNVYLTRVDRLSLTPILQHHLTAHSQNHKEFTLQHLSSCNADDCVQGHDLSAFFYSNTFSKL